MMPSFTVATTRSIAQKLPAEIVIAPSETNEVFVEETFSLYFSEAYTSTLVHDSETSYLFTEPPSFISSQALPSFIISPDPLISSFSFTSSLSSISTLSLTPTLIPTPSFADSASVMVSSSPFSLSSSPSLIIESPSTPVLISNMYIIAGVTTGGVVILLTIAAIILCVTSLVCVLKSPKKKDGIASVDINATDDNTLETNPFYGCSIVLAENSINESNNMLYTMGNDNTMENNPSYGCPVIDVNLSYGYTTIPINNMSHTVSVNDDAVDLIYDECVTGSDDLMKERGAEYVELDYVTMT